MPTTTDTDVFKQESHAAVLNLRRALADVLASVGADATQPQEMARRFGLDKTLTWRIARVIRERDALEAVPHIPRRPSVRLFVDAMSRHGAPAETTDALLRAMDGFEQFIEVHTGDRETLEAIMSAGAGRTTDKRMEAFRKDGFQASSAIWGIRAKLQFALNVLAPASDEGFADVVTVCGFVDLQRLRPDVPWAVASAKAWDLPDGQQTGPRIPPMSLNPSGLIHGVPLLPEFCSEPLPRLRAVRVPGGNSRFEIVQGPVGNAGSSTVVLGWRWGLTVPIHESMLGELGEHGMYLSTPVESANLDLFVHRSLTFALQPTARVYSDLPSGPRYPTEGVEAGRLPLPDRIVHLGASPPDTTTVEIPRYGAIAEFAVGSLGLAMNDFHGFRYTLRYPPIPTLALVQHRLLARP